MENIEVLNALNTLRKYCKGCIPNNLLDECKKNCIFYKMYNNNNGCSILDLFSDYYNENGTFHNKEITIKELNIGHFIK